MKSQYPARAAVDAPRPVSTSVSRLLVAEYRQRWHAVSENALLLLQQAVDSDLSQGHPFVDRIVNVIFFHVRGHAVHSEAIQHMQAALTGPVTS